MMLLVSRIVFFELWDIEPEKEGGSFTQKTSDVPVEFTNVKFAYDEENQILKGVDFSVEKREKVALVGSLWSRKIYHNKAFSRILY